MTNPPSRTARCGVRFCRRKATRAFDVWSPWRVGGAYRGIPKEHRHYEVCGEHAEELWPSMPEDGGRYLDREDGDRIRREAVSR